MRLDAVTSNCTGPLVWPVVRALSLLAIAALQTPCSFAAPHVDDRLTKPGAGDSGKNSALAKSMLTPGKKADSTNCADCHGRDLKGVVGRPAPDSSDHVTPYDSGNVDTGPNAILIIAGGVSLSAIVGIVLLGFFGFQEQVGSADQGQSQSRKGLVDI
jgi:hypothetical protein